MKTYAKAGINRALREKAKKSLRDFELTFIYKGDSPPKKESKNPISTRIKSSFFKFGINLLSLLK